MSLESRFVHRETSRRSERGGLLGEVIALVLMVVLLVVTTVWGAFASTRHHGAYLRAEYDLRARVAANLGLDRGAITRGHKSYVGTCTGCHGERGEALPNLGKDLSHSEFVAGQSDGQMIMFLKLGRNTWDPLNTTGVAMPPKGGNPMLNDDDIKDIVAYLRYLQAVARRDTPASG